MPVASIKPAVSSLKPVGQKILVKREADPVTLGGIYAPDNHRHTDPARGVVREVNYGVEHVKRGDTVLFRREMGYQKVEIGGESLEVVPMTCVFAVLPK